MINKIILTIAFVFLMAFGFQFSSTTPTKFKQTDTSPVVSAVSVDTNKISMTDVRGKKILFIGDSHTALKGGWQDQLCKLTGMVGTTASKVGATSGWLCRNYERLIDTNYKYCMIWAGANDAASATNLDTTIKNIQKLVNRCNKMGVRCIVLTGFNPDVVQITSYNQKQIGFYPPKYHQLQNKMKTDIKKAIVLQNWYVDRKDGDCADYLCHMSVSGHTKMSRGIYKNLFY